MKIYGSPRTSAGRVYWMAEELGLKYEGIVLDMAKGAHKEPDYLKINPNGKVPALVDGDVVLFESMAITNYLAEKNASALGPQTPAERGEILQWSFWASSELQGPVIDWFIQERFVPVEKKDEKLIAKVKERLPGLLSVLDQKLSGKSWLVGERFTAADLNVSSVVNILIGLHFDFSSYKNISKWLGQIKERPAFKKYLEMRTH